MNFPSNRYRVELVGSADSGDLLEILEQEEFPGAISLLYTRRPDPFRSLNKDGEEVHIVGVREMSSGSIIGFGACSINTLYINGQATPVAYLSTLRLRKEFRNQRVPLIQCYRRMLDIISERNIPPFLRITRPHNSFSKKTVHQCRSIAASVAMRSP